MAEGSEARGVDSALLCTVPNKCVQNSNADLKNVIVYLSKTGTMHFPGLRIRCMDKQRFIILSSFRRVAI